MVWAVAARMVWAVAARMRAAGPVVATGEAGTEVAGRRVLRARAAAAVTEKAEAEGTSEVEKAEMERRSRR